MSKTSPAGMRPFTFCYRKQATARVGRVETVECEGIEFSDGIVALKEEKKVFRYGSLDELHEAYAHHGKGTIRFADEAQEQDEEQTKP
jgi:hypothetical protein